MKWIRNNEVGNLRQLMEHMAETYKITHDSSKTRSRAYQRKQIKARLKR